MMAYCRTISFQGNELIQTVMKQIVIVRDKTNNQRISVQLKIKRLEEILPNIRIEVDDIDKAHQKMEIFNDEYIIVLNSHFTRYSKFAE